MTSSQTLLPACLGGTPTFPTAIPMAAPRLPAVEVLLPQFERVVRSGMLTKGKELAEFEGECAAYLGVPHCLGVSSCTSGLMLVFQALRRRQAPDLRRRKIAVPSFTFMASVAAMIWAGFEPEFVEVDPSSMNLCLSDLEDVLANEDVAAVLGVHCFGNPVPTESITAMCQNAGVPLIFDAAHGFGSRYRDVPVGQAGWCQIFSLTPTKMVVSGEGGIISTSDEELARELSLAREYGNDGSYDSVMAGLNARLSELHCVLGRESLKMLEETVAFRNKAACQLYGALHEIPGLGFQSITPESRTTYKDFTISVDPKIFGCSRDALAWALQSEGVPSRAYFSPPCHLHQAYRGFHHRPLPQTEDLADRCLSIPLLGSETVSGLAQAFQKIQSHAEQVGQAGSTAVGG